MFWHGQAIFESKGDKLSSSAECRIRTQGLWNRISSRLNVCWQTVSAIENRAQTLNLIAHIPQYVHIHFIFRDLFWDRGHFYWAIATWVRWDGLKKKPLGWLSLEAQLFFFGWLIYSWGEEERLRKWHCLAEARIPDFSMVVRRISHYTVSALLTAGV